jgi:hypothetical protein
MTDAMTLKTLIKKLDLQEEIAKKKYDLELLNWNIDSFDDKNYPLDNAKANWDEKLAVCVAVSKALGKDENGVDIFFKILQED